MEFCYIARLDVITEKTLAELRDALVRFQHYRTVFQDTDIRPTGFALPRQHSMVHYFFLIRQFGAPNGLCSSITESMHRHAVKKPWRRSNRYNAIGQMLLTNQRLDKLAAACVDFTERGMLDGTCLSDIQKSLGMLSFLFSWSLTNCCFKAGSERGGDPFGDVDDDDNQDGDRDDDDDDRDDNDNDDDNAAVDGVRVQAHAELARTISEYYSSATFLTT